MDQQCATAPYNFATRTVLPLEAVFDGGRLTSDGGLPWLAQVDTALGLCAGLAARLPEWRRAHIRYSREHLVRQRVLQIACGYADQNDATTLRHDPLLKLVCGQAPESGLALAGQSTFSRLENRADRHVCLAVAHALLEVYLRAREQDGAPTHILLDLDGTDDPTHGHQEGTAYHGYYEHYMYFPLLVYDGETDQLITALLRPGTVHGSRGLIPVLRVLVRAIRARWPGVAVEIRADSGCGSPKLYHFCERHHLTYTLGLGTNRRLAALAAPLRPGASPAGGQRGGDGALGGGDRLSSRELAPAASRRLQGRSLGQGPQRALRRHHPSGCP